MMSDEPEDRPDGVPSPQRRLLMLGAVSASAVVSIRPALAQTAGSIVTCQIPVPDPSQSGKWVGEDGRLVTPDPMARPGGSGPFPPVARPFTGEEVKRAMNGGSLPGVDPQASQAYMKYIGRLQAGMSGFTCYASLQMPRR